MTYSTKDSKIHQHILQLVFRQCVVNSGVNKKSFFQLVLIHLMYLIPSYHLETFPTSLKQKLVAPNGFMFNFFNIWDIQVFFKYFGPAIYLFKVNHGNTRAMWEICSKLTIKTPESSHWYEWRRTDVFTIILNRFTFYFGVSINDFQQLRFLSISSFRKMINKHEASVFLETPFTCIKRHRLHYDKFRGSDHYERLCILMHNSLK